MEIREGELNVPSIELDGDTVLPVVHMEDRGQTPVLPIGNNGRDVGLPLENGAPRQASRCLEVKDVQQDANVPGNDNDDDETDDIDMLDIQRRSWCLTVGEYGTM